MQRAGEGAAAEIVRRYGSRLDEGVAVFAGPGNNGGDGWVVASELARAGVRVRVIQIDEPRTPDAIAARDAALQNNTLASQSDRPRLAVDALLGTGSRGGPRGGIADAVRQVNALRQHGAVVVSLDVPSGLDATTGANELCVVADITLSFGGVKRGTLLARDCCGEILVLDIGLDEGDPWQDTRYPLLVDRDWVTRNVPLLQYDAHKGERKRLAIVSGGSGMAGAAVLAARAALRSGIGSVRALVAPENTAALVAGVPAALVSAWPATADDVRAGIAEWADALVVGPGLGRTPLTRKLVELILRGSKHPVVLDADALNLFEGDTASLRELLGGRQALLTPHIAEFARLAATDVNTVLEQRFGIGSQLANNLGATVLLKGAPTIIFSPDGPRLVVARGTAALGTGGSGDLLAGIAGTILAQTGDPAISAGAAAWIHGRAAELCEYVRGTTLDDVLYALPRAWNETDPPLGPPLLARLPAVPR